MIRDIFDGKKGPARDIAALNAAGALVVAGQSENLKIALARAEAAIDDGSARRALEMLARYSAAE
jgi:anthranilate phosphoribosyltransferase